MSNNSQRYSPGSYDSRKFREGFGNSVRLKYQRQSNFSDGLTLYQLLSGWAKHTPDAIAIVAPGCAALNYEQLVLRVDRMVATLNGMGIGRHDRLAVALPNGPAMGITFLAVASYAVFAPLNPAYREHEVDFYLSDLNAKALIVDSGLDSSAALIARRRGIPVLTMSPKLELEGDIVALQGGAASASIEDYSANPDDIAMVLYTSGTTAMPKRVPLTHGNLLTSANNVKTSLALNANDRCLNVMPLYHIHGLVGAVLSSLAAGASVAVPPGFDPTAFFGWLEQFHPSWYTAVPVIHHAILQAAKEQVETVQRSALRFIRSSSAPLPKKLMAELEEVFKVPVVEAYGMTEASHQIASNPLPPDKRKAGSVGLPAGPEIALVDKVGNFLPRGENGEIVLRGGNVTEGYEGNPEANERAFINGWFRTGDEGYLDNDGYLFLAGRLKEMINRGGEKVSPYEIEIALMDHPAIAEAAVFALPHQTLGEDVAAAVVLKDNASVTERELQRFIALKLADFKIPRWITTVDQIPKSTTGKVQRDKLAEEIGLRIPSHPRGHAGQALPATNRMKPNIKGTVVPPRNGTEEKLGRIWARLFRIQQISIDDNFFALGGHSLLAVRLFAEIEKEFHKQLPLSSLFEEATIEHLACLINQKTPLMSRSSLVAIQPRGAKGPFFCVHDFFGEVFCYINLAHSLGEDQPFYALRARGLNRVEEPLTDIETMAAHYIEDLQTAQPRGPYALGGFSFGGIVAFEMAQQLHTRGQIVNVVALLDSDAGHFDRSQATWKWSFLTNFLRDFPSWLIGFSELNRAQWLNLIKLKIRKAKARQASSSAQDYGPRLIMEMGDLFQFSERHRNIARAQLRALAQYRPRVYPGRLTLFRARMQPLFSAHDPDNGWRPLAGGGLDIRVVPGNHLAMLQEPHVKVLAEQLRDCLDRAQTQSAK